MTEPGKDEDMISGMSFAEAQQIEQDDNQPLDPQDWAHSPFGAMPTKSQSAEEAKLNEALRAAFGPEAPFASVHRVDVDGGPVLDVPEIVVINEALIFIATMFLLKAAPSAEQAKELDELSRDAGMRLVEAIDFIHPTHPLFALLNPTGTAANRAQVLRTIGEKLLKIGKDMQDGKTIGMFVAPF